MDKKTQNILLLAGTGVAVYYFFFHKRNGNGKGNGTNGSSGFSRLVNGDKDKAEDGCFVVSKYQGNFGEPHWESPCPYPESSSSFSNIVTGGGCWVEFVDPDTGQLIPDYRDPCPVTLPDPPQRIMMNGGKGGRRTPRRRRRRF